MSPAQKKIAEHFAAILTIVYEEDRKDDNSGGPHDHVIGMDTFWSLFHDHWGAMRDVMRLARLERKTPEQIRAELITAAQSSETWDLYQKRYQSRLGKM
jgi:hypothetical protein